MFDLFSEMGYHHLYPPGLKSVEGLEEMERKLKHTSSIVTRIFITWVFGVVTLHAIIELVKFQIRLKPLVRLCSFAIPIYLDAADEKYYLDSLGRTRNQQCLHLNVVIFVSNV